MRPNDKKTRGVKILTPPIKSPILVLLSLSGQINPPPKDVPFDQDAIMALGQDKPADPLVEDEDSPLTKDKPVVYRDAVMALGQDGHSLYECENAQPD